MVLILARITSLPRAATTSKSNAGLLLPDAISIPLSKSTIAAAIAPLSVSILSTKCCRFIIRVFLNRLCGLVGRSERWVFYHFM